MVNNQVYDCEYSLFQNQNIIFVLLKRRKKDIKYWKNSEVKYFSSIIKYDLILLINLRISWFILKLVCQEEIKNVEQ